MQQQPGHWLGCIAEFGIGGRQPVADTEEQVLAQLENFERVILALSGLGILGSCCIRRSKKGGQAKPDRPP